MDQNDATNEIIRA